MTAGLTYVASPASTGLAVYIVAWAIALPWMVWNQWREIGGKR